MLLSEKGTIGDLNYVFLMTGTTNETVADAGRSFCDD